MPSAMTTTTNVIATTKNGSQKRIGHIDSPPPSARHNHLPMLRAETTTTPRKTSGALSTVAPTTTGATVQSEQAAATRASPSSAKLMSSGGGALRAFRRSSSTNPDVAGRNMQRKEMHPTSGRRVMKMTTRRPITAQKSASSTVARSGTDHQSSEMSRMESVLRAGPTLLRAATPRNALTSRIGVISSRSPTEMAKATALRLNTSSGTRPMAVKTDVGTASRAPRRPSDW